MKLRFRFLAALLALTSLLTFSVGETWAAVCASNMEAGISAETAAAAPTCAVEVSMSGMDDAGQTDGNGPSAPHCPSMPMGAAGACGAMLALPAESFLQIESSVQEAWISLPPDDARDLLLDAHFFRPPIA